MSWGDVSSGGGGGLLIPSSASIPFASVSVRDAWAASNLSDLVKDTTAVNVTGSSWFVWRGATNPESYDSLLWVNGDELVKGKDGAKGNDGEKGNTGETVKINSITNEITESKLSTTVSLDDGTSATSEPVSLPDGGVIFDGVLASEIEVTNGIKGDITNDGKLLLTQTMARTAWYFVDVPVSSTPYEIKTTEQMGIDYEFVGSPEPQSVQLFQEGLADGSQVKVSVNGYKSTDKPVNIFQETPTGTFNWHITTPTVFMLHNSYWRVEESSQLVHINGSTGYGDNTEKSIVHAVAVDPVSDITMAINDAGVLIVGRTFTPPTDLVDVAFWWSDNSYPNSSDIILALGQPQSSNVISKSTDVGGGDLQSRSFTAKRAESGFKYCYFAWPSGIFHPEPTKVDTGFGAPSSWIVNDVVVSGVNYKVMTVEITNNSQSLEDYALVQEGLL